MRRKDGPAIRDTLIWFAVLGTLETLLYQTWATWRAVPGLAEAERIAQAAIFCFARRGFVLSM